MDEIRKLEDSINKKRLNGFWTADENKVDKDVHDTLTNCTEAERHEIVNVLKLFSLCG
jgi:ribonucleotide reductase beta subunit family protein with ferritin-like domain